MITDKPFYHLYNKNDSEIWTFKEAENILTLKRRWLWAKSSRATAGLASKAGSETVYLSAWKLDRFETWSAFETVNR